MMTIVDSKSVPYEKRIQNLCRLPYYGHPRGCPNFGKKEGCPPQPLIEKVLDLNSKLYVIYTEFGVGKFAERMRLEHPKWKNQPRQWYNPRRWQLKARKEHRQEIETFLAKHKDLIAIKCPEAHGVNVTALMQNIGITLNWGWPPKHGLDNKVHLVSIAGRPFV